MFFLCCLLLNLEKKCRIHTTQMSLFDLYGVFNVQDRTQCSTLNWRPQYLNSKFKSNVCFAKSPRQSIAATSIWVIPKCIFEVLKCKHKVKGKKKLLPSEDLYSSLIINHYRLAQNNICHHFQGLKLSLWDLVHPIEPL